MPNSRKQCRFAFTLFDYQDWTPPLDAIPDRIRYLCFGEEKCPSTNREHLQGYIVYRCPTGIADANVLDFDNRASLRVARGTTDQNIVYCSKDGRFTEFGDKPPESGQTLVQLVSDLENKSTNVDRIVLELPEMYHRYGRTLDRVEDIVLGRNLRDFKPCVHWLWGPTGVGKTRRAVELAGGSCYWWQLNDRDWQDGYRGQSSVIIDDFRGSIPYDQLLRMLDRYPFSVSRRGRLPFPLLARTIIITSSLSPEQCYRRRHQQDGIGQLLRRIEHLVELSQDATSVVVLGEGEVGGGQGNNEPGQPLTDSEQPPFDWRPRWGIEPVGDV